MRAAKRESLKEMVAESDVGHVVDEGTGDLIIMPAQAFDAEQLPDVDLGPYLVEREGEPRVPIPRHLPHAFRGGLHVVAPHHIAMMWADLDAATLREEVNLREEHGLPVPAVARERLDREVYR